MITFMPKNNVGRLGSYKLRCPNCDRLIKAELYPPDLVGGGAAHICPKCQRPYMLILTPVVKRIGDDIDD